MNWRLVMRTDYGAHDIPYARKKAAGCTGWNTADQTADCLHVIRSLLAKIDLPGHAAVCEIGCGAGNVTEWLCDQGWLVTGVDVSQVAIQWALERCHGRAIEFVHGDICRPSLFGPATFDLIVDGLCLHCIIGADRAKVIANIHTWLKPCGHVAVHTMCGDPVGEITADYDPISRCTVSNGIATRYFAEPSEILRDFQQAGFHCLFHEIVESPGTQSTLHALFQKVP